MKIIFLKKNLFKILKIIAGILLIILGSAGLFLPFLQGILFIALGITLIFGKSAWKKIKKLKKHIEKKFAK